MRPLNDTPTFLQHATDDLGFPTWEFEAFYQQGLSCFTWGLPKSLVRKAFRHLCASWKARALPLSMWQIRAFVYGTQGKCEAGYRERKAAPDYEWPLPPDPSWILVICAYPDGVCDLDFLHPVSGRFWSEDNGFLDLPSYDTSCMGRWWFEDMGFEVMQMQPAMQVSIGSRKPHLKLV